MSETHDLHGRIMEIRERMAKAAVRAGRDPGEVSLLAVTKTVEAERLRGAYGEGLRDFGENRVQDALGKIQELPHDIRWHLIGQLQTNKINKVLGRFVLIHSVDSVDLAAEISKRTGERTQDILLEVNTSGESAKAGVDPAEAPEAAGKIMGLGNLRLRGFMTVGPLTEDPDLQRKAFRRLRDLFERVKSGQGRGDFFSILSMGMSGDFETAIEEGSTLVRVGTALFGPRGR